MISVYQPLTEAQKDVSKAVCGQLHYGEVKVRTNMPAISERVTGFSGQ